MIILKWRFQSMIFLDAIEDFLRKEKEKKGDGTALTYRRKIYIFHEFVTLELKANDINYIYVLTAMGLDRLLDSVAYYQRVGNIKSRATIDVYYAVLGNFFKFIYEEYGWKNDYFYDYEHINQFKIAYENKIKEIGLNNSKQEPPVDKDVAKEILNRCNQLIDDVDIEDVLMKKKGVYSNYISALMVKLVLLYGLRNDVIRKLKLGDYNIDLNKLTVNKFCVRLPDRLAMQMKRYIEIRDAVLAGCVNDRLFFDDTNFEKELDNTKMFIVLNSVTGNAQSRAVAKYAIIEMLKNGISAEIIMEFTGYKKNVLDDCQDKINEERGLLLMNEKCQILDAELRKSDLYNDM